MRALVVPVVVAVMLLTGCSAAGAVDTAAATKAPTQSATPTPTPKVLTIEEAGTRYKEAVCPANAVLTELNAAYEKGDLAAIKAASAKAVIADAAGGKILDDDPMIIWPVALVPDVHTVRDALFGRASTDTQAAAAHSLDAVNSIAWPNEDAAGTASQRLRSRLGLSSDVLSSCK